MKTFRAYQPEQRLLMPPSLEEWLPEGHLARFLSDVIGELDLREMSGGRISAGCRAVLAAGARASCRREGQPLGAERTLAGTLARAREAARSAGRLSAEARYRGTHFRADQTVSRLPAISIARSAEGECGVADHLRHAQSAEALSISRGERLKGSRDQKRKNGQTTVRCFRQNRTLGQHRNHPFPPIISDRLRAPALHMIGWITRTSAERCRAEESV